ECPKAFPVQSQCLNLMTLTQREIPYLLNNVKILMIITRDMNICQHELEFIKKQEHADRKV
ncbi:hypothetical protein, partial [uncultured Lactobacillus sp.]|uniref:hypothetical protein n=1 Tax=uncultured Lactobacillus sp. TaxID=153152 RepID=UPI002666094E